MKLKWTDVYDIAIELEELYPEVDVVNIRFTDLWKWVSGLACFDDNPEEASEKILEAIQRAWLEEKGLA